MRGGGLAVPDVEKWFKWLRAGFFILLPLYPLSIIVPCLVPVWSAEHEIVGYIAGAVAVTVLVSSLVCAWRCAGMIGVQPSTKYTFVAAGVFLAGIAWYIFVAMMYVRTRNYLRANR